MPAAANQPMLSPRTRCWRYADTRNSSSICIDRRHCPLATLRFRVQTRGFRTASGQVCTTRIQATRLHGTKHERHGCPWPDATSRSAEFPSGSGSGSVPAPSAGRIIASRRVEWIMDCKFAMPSMSQAEFRHPTVAVTGLDQRPHDRGSQSSNEMPKSLKPRLRSISKRTQPFKAQLKCTDCRANTDVYRRNLYDRP